MCFAQCMIDEFVCCCFFRQNDRSYIFTLFSSNRRSQQPTVVTGPQSIQVLNYEASELKQKINDMADRLTQEQLHQLETKLRTIEDQSNRLVHSLRRGGKPTLDGKNERNFFKRRKKQTILFDISRTRSRFGRITLSLR